MSAADLEDELPWPLTANELFRAAQAFIKMGQPVFPCKSNDGEKTKAPLTRNGLKDATLDIRQAQRWWKQYPTAAIGIPTGIVWDVLDVDVKDGADGRAHLHRLTKLGLLNGCKRVVRTPSGGYHLFFLPGQGLTNKAKGATLGLDMRSLGGYVVAAPSYVEGINSDDEEYAGYYEDLGETTGSTDDPIWWDLIVNEIQPMNTETRKPIAILPSDRRSIAPLREFTANLKSGERNNGFHWAVCRCIEGGIDPHELMEAAMLTGLGEEEILKTIGSALTRAGVMAADLQTEAEVQFPSNH